MKEFKDASLYFKKASKPYTNIERELIAQQNMSKHLRHAHLVERISRVINFARSIIRQVQAQAPIIKKAKNAVHIEFLLQQALTMVESELCNFPQKDIFTEIEILAIIVILKIKIMMNKAEE